jgi:hypothetical protein
MFEFLVQSRQQTDVIEGRMLRMGLVKNYFFEGLIAVLFRMVELEVWQFLSEGWRFGLVGRFHL